MSTGAEALARALGRLGGAVVFGAPGAHNLPLILSLRANGLRFLALNGPGEAIRAADGFARRTGRPGVLVNGPGTHPLRCRPEMDEAVRAETALLVVEVAVAPPPPPGPRRTSPAPVPSPEDQAGHFVLRPADDITAVLRQARAHCLTHPRRPAVITLAPGFLSAPAAPEPEDEPADSHSRPHSGEVEHQQLRRAAKLVDDSQHVLLWAGGGALRAGAGGAVAELAEKLGAPVVTTTQGSGLLPARHPCLVGLPPHLPQIGSMWDKADLVVAIGSDLDEQETQGWRMPVPRGLVAVNVDPADAGRNYRPDVLLRGDAKTLTKALADVVSYRGGTAVVRSRIQDIRDSVRRELAQSDSDALAFLDAVGAALPDRTTVVADPCAAGRWMAAFHEWTLPRTLVFPTDLDTVGFGLPAAVGVVAAGSSDPVVAVVGDRGLLAGLGQLAVLSAEKLPLTVLAVDDDGPGRLRPVLAALGADADTLDSPSPDFAATARTFGLRADRVDGSGEGLVEALRAHVAAPDPTMLVVRASLGQPPTDASRWHRAESLE